MYFVIGALLSDIAREASVDKTSKATFSVVNTVCCIGATAQNFRALATSVRRSQEDLSEALPNLTRAVKENTIQSKAA